MSGCGGFPTAKQQTPVPDPAEESLTSLDSVSFLSLQSLRMDLLEEQNKTKPCKSQGRARQPVRPWGFA
ncbi:hypothetical protein PZA11_006278 [Diplocarpon coronariae]